MSWTICICGPRTLANPEVIRAAMDYAGLTGLTPETIAEVVSCGARGADTLGEQWAAEHEIPVRRFPADWRRHGRRAGPIRNNEMVGYLRTKMPEAAVVAIDTGSKGTADMMRRSAKAGIRVVAYRPVITWLDLGDGSWVEQVDPVGCLYMAAPVSEGEGEEPPRHGDHEQVPCPTPRGEG